MTYFLSAIVAPELNQKYPAFWNQECRHLNYIKSGLEIAS